MVSAALWFCFLARFGLGGVKSRKFWMVNAEDLVSSAEASSHKATWSGDSRNRQLSLRSIVQFFAPCVRVVGRFIRNALFRRVM